MHSDIGKKMEKLLGEKMIPSEERKWEKLLGMKVDSFSGKETEQKMPWGKLMSQIP